MSVDGSDGTVSTDTESSSVHSLRSVSLVGLIVGAIGSVTLMLYVGRSSPQRLLMVLFAGWVASPFVLLAFGYSVSKRWSVAARIALYWVTLIVAVTTLAAYGFYALWPTKSIPTPVFVATPPLSWALSMIAIGSAALIARRRTE